jgi:hypothetical protein
LRKGIKKIGIARLIVMKLLSLAFILLLGPALWLTAFGAPAQTKGAQSTKSDVSKFTGKWKGAEKCNDASAPLALVFISGKGSDIFLTGIYSIQGQVKATAKGDTIFIPKQEVADPNFKNLFVEGKLAFAAKPSSLSGKIAVFNNQKKDECFVKYFK